MDRFLQGISMATAIFLLASMLATINERLVEFLAKPLLERYGLGFWTPYVALTTGALIAVGFGLDLFAPVMESLEIAPSVPWAGLALTAALVGGGSTILHKVWPES